MTNSADPDLDIHCLQKQDISGFSRTRVKSNPIFFERINGWIAKVVDLLQNDAKISLYSPYADTDVQVKVYYAHNTT